MHILFFILLFSGSILSQENQLSQFPELYFGEPSEKLTVDKSDISNPQSWEETEFQIKNPTSFLGEIPSRKTISFWNDRMHAVRFSFSGDVGAKLIENLTKEYGAYQYSEMSGRDLATSWKIGTIDIMLLSSKTEASLFISDSAQKEFHFSDLFHGILFYLILTFVGMFGGYLFLGWLFTSYCNRCKTFNMKITGVTLSNLKDYDPSLLSSSMHSDTTYVHKCSKCGNIRKDRYSGFWDWYRSKG